MTRRPTRWPWVSVIALLAWLGGLTAHLSVPVAAQQESPKQAGDGHKSKAALAVMPFQAAPEVMRKHSADVELLYDALVRIFVKSNKFNVLERTKIESVINENQFATSTVGDPGNAMQFGKLTGAQYLVAGNIRDLGVRASREKIPYTNEWKCRETARLRLEVRVIQTQTGRIVSANTAGTGKKTPTREVSCNRSRQTTLDDLMNTVAANLVARVVDNVYPLRVVHISRNELTLNRGEGSAFRTGSVLECFTTGEAIVDPDTGDLLGYDETSVGMITVTKIMSKLSKARPEPGMKIPLRAVCRVTKRAPSAKSAAEGRKPKVSW